jgi:hypothetical protein
MDTYREKIRLDFFGITFFIFFEERDIFRASNAQDF